MKKRNILQALVILLTFTGGILTGVLYSANKTVQESKPLKIKEVPKSTKKLVEKEIPEERLEESKVLVGYVQDFRDPNVVDYSKLTHVIFSFAHPTPDGGILLNGDSAINN